MFIALLTPAPSLVDSSGAVSLAGEYCLWDARKIDFLGCSRYELHSIRYSAYAIFLLFSVVILFNLEFLDIFINQKYNTHN